ncbi:periplasmic binding protein/LacI transcriptional regulator [Brachyspira pilosicoli WesB]|uniref:Periplasmic binding protein/LacI transcriptional regulator n=1 Tax=Brachyspira pilosicoli WesB TaxID=1161918 RepID=K0JLV7_BRAPL|nr:sugar ABC transporter substrate-binding protein [Brachyspira pilosicoli]CCG58089.1 periplasmic binding protein/LacI transcriptional regulator [Brachyspira pilosicoli WesB]
MKKIILVFSICFILLMSFASCNRGEDQNKGRKFGYTCFTMNNPFFITIADSIREELAKNGDTLVVLDPQLDQAKQISQIEDMISQGVDLMFLNPVDWKGVKPALDALKAAGVPIVNFDAEVYDKELVDSVVVSDNFQAGFVCGEDLAKRMPNGGKLAIIEYAVNKPVLDRINGFYAGLGDVSNKFELVSRQDGVGQLEISLPIAENILQANPDVQVFFGGNDPIALGVVAALKAANKTGVLVYGVDGSPEIKAFIKSGEVTGTGAQSPINIGKKAAEVAYKILNGEPYEKNISVETSLIDQNNVDQYGTEGWQ